MCLAMPAATVVALARSHGVAAFNLLEFTTCAGMYIYSRSACGDLERKAIVVAREHRVGPQPVDDRGVCRDVHLQS